MIRRSLLFVFVLAAPAVTLSCTSDRAANLRHPVGGTDRFTVTSVSPDARYAGPPRPSPVELTSGEVAAASTECKARPRAIEFYSGSTSIDPSQLRAVDHVAECLNTAFRGVDVVLVGRADPDAASAEERAAGKGRARLVRDRLVARGVASDRIVVATPAEPAPACIGLGRTSGVEILLAETASRAPR